jgi:hypothetical protein
MFLDGKVTYCCHRLTPKILFWGRVWSLARDNNGDPCGPRQILLYYFGDFLQRRHVSFPSKII